MPSIIVPTSYSYVLAAVTSTYWLNLWQITRVTKARKNSGVNYPQVYAEKAEAAASKEAMIFNCTQRAHQNTVETLPHVIFGLLFTGLKYPILAASLGGLFTVGRILYTLSYGTGSPERRAKFGGGIALAVVPVLLLTSTYTAFEFIREGL